MDWEHFSATDYNYRDNKDAIYIIWVIIKVST